MKNCCGKDFTISQYSNKSWKIVKKELQKCILLCSCCHRIEHAGVRDEKFMAVVKKYNGRLLDF